MSKISWEKFKAEEVVVIAGDGDKAKTAKVGHRVDIGYGETGERKVKIELFECEGTIRHELTHAAKTTRSSKKGGFSAPKPEDLEWMDLEKKIPKMCLNVKINLAKIDNREKIEAFLDELNKMSSIVEEGTRKYYWPTKNASKTKKKKEGEDDDQNKEIDDFMTVVFDDPNGDENVKWIKVSLYPNTFEGSNMGKLINFYHIYRKKGKGGSVSTHKDKITDPFDLIDKKVKVRPVIHFYDVFWNDTAKKIRGKVDSVILLSIADARGDGRFSQDDTLDEYMNNPESVPFEDENDNSEEDEGEKEPKKSNVNLKQIKNRDTIEDEPEEKTEKKIKITKKLNVDAILDETDE